MIYDPAVEVRPLRNVTHLISEAVRSARILVVDDDASNLRLIRLILKCAGFVNVRCADRATDVLPFVREFGPDIVLLDLHLPGADGIDLIGEIGCYTGPDDFLPVLVLTGDSSVSARDAALSAGANDFVTKPYEATEVVLRVRNLIETRLLHVERTNELEAAKLELLERLARASDFRDETTHAHTRRVGELSARIAARIGLPEAQVEQLRVAARLHDIGKIGVSDLVLLKTEKLEPAEFRDQERHTLIGANILSGSRFTTLRLAEEVALTHHESWDGTGYPRGLAGEDIPLSGRIVAVADVFDALTHERPYKHAWTTAMALDEIVSKRGTKFDPSVVDAFLDIVDEYVAEQSGSASRDGELYGQHVTAQPYSKRARLVRDILRSGALGQVEHE
jgi:putative two-component system response regulator